MNDPQNPNAGPLTLADVARVKAEFDCAEAQRIKLVVFHSRRDMAEAVRNSALPSARLSPTGDFLGFIGPELAVCPLLAKEPGKVVGCRTIEEIAFAKTFVALWEAEERRKALNAYEARAFARWVEEQT